LLVARHSFYHPKIFSCRASTAITTNATIVTTAAITITCASTTTSIVITYITVLIAIVMMTPSLPPLSAQNIGISISI
jgi:hypothetical protein